MLDDDISLFNGSALYDRAYPLLCARSVDRRTIVRIRPYNRIKRLR